MALTPRNHINVSNDYPHVLETVDTLYEIADAEFDSDNRIHAMWSDLQNEHKEFRGLFAQHLRWEIDRIVRREQLTCSTHQNECVCKRIAQDWYDHYIGE